METLAVMTDQKGKRFTVTVDTVGQVFAGPLCISAFCDRSNAVEYLETKGARLIERN